MRDPDKSTSYFRVAAAIDVRDVAAEVRHALGPGPLPWSVAYSRFDGSSLPSQPKELGRRAHQLAYLIGGKLGGINLLKFGGSGRGYIQHGRASPTRLASFFASLSRAEAVAESTVGVTA